jgi:hypothetical protein
MGYWPSVGRIISPANWRCLSVGQQWVNGPYMLQPPEKGKVPQLACRMDTPDPK